MKATKEEQATADLQQPKKPPVYQQRPGLPEAKF